MPEMTGRLEWLLSTWIREEPLSTDCNNVVHKLELHRDLLVANLNACRKYRCICPCLDENLVRTLSGHEAMRDGRDSGS